jgi:hypothetical protein
MTKAIGVLDLRVKSVGGKVWTADFHPCPLSRHERLKGDDSEIEFSIF